MLHPGFSHLFGTIGRYRIAPDLPTRSARMSQVKAAFGVVMQEEVLCLPLFIHLWFHSNCRARCCGGWQ